MEIKKVKVYDLNESIEASKYPMSVDLDLLNDKITNTTLALANCPKGSGDDQFLTGIRVNFNLTFTCKAWIEMERYNFVNFVSSQSTMHRIARFNLENQFNEYVDKRVIKIIEELRDKYNETHSPEDYLTLLYNVPSGFQLTARLTTNYRQLKTIYSQRKTHRLPEWREFCKWIETLPHSEFIIGPLDKKGEI